MSVTTKRKKSSTAGIERERRRHEESRQDGTAPGAIHVKHHPPSTDDRQWIPLGLIAHELGIRQRTLKAHLGEVEFVRILGDRWYVHRARFYAWWDEQRPRQKLMQDAGR